MPIVVDATVFRYLVIAEATDILPALFGTVVVPPVVVEELQQELDMANSRNTTTTPGATTSSSTPNRPVLDAIRNLQNPSGGAGGDAPANPS